MPRVRTTPSANACRNRAGRVRRLLSSIVCSCSPSSVGGRCSFSTFHHFTPFHTTVNLPRTTAHLSRNRGKSVPVPRRPLHAGEGSCECGNANVFSGSDPAGERPVREADQWRGSGGTGRFPQRPIVREGVSGNREVSPAPYRARRSGGTGKIPQRPIVREGVSGNREVSPAP